MTKPLSSPISETGCREDLAEKGPVVLAFMGSDYEIAVDGIDVPRWVCEDPQSR